MTKTYYHATPFENFEPIMRAQEVRTGCDGVVYLTEKPDEAARFLAIRGCKKILVLGFELEDNMVTESFDHSEKFFRCKAYAYPESISMDFLVAAQTFQF